MPPHPPAATPAPYLAPFPLRTGGFRKVRGKPAAPAPSPNTTPSPPILWLGVQAGMKPARERQTAGKLFAETPASSGGQPLPSLRHPLPALRAIRHCTSTVHSCVMMGGGTKRILFSKVSLRFGGGSREKRKQGLPAPGIRVLTGWRGDRSAHSATPNSQLCGTLATGAGVRGPPARAPLVPGGATRGVSQRLRPRPGVSSAEPPTHIKQCLKARGRQIKTGVRVTHPHLSPPRG